MKRLVLFAVAILATFPSYAHRGDHIPAEDVYTLYRSSALDKTMRIHMATFDSADGKEYNEENCALVRDLILTLPNIAVAYWCERGYVSDAK